MPRWARAAAGIVSRFWSRNEMLPCTAGTMPQMVLNRVDLPAPFGPTTVTKRPSATDSDTSISARRPPYATERLRISSIGNGAGSEKEESEGKEKEAAPRPLAGGGWGEGEPVGLAQPPPPSPLPQGDGEHRRHPRQHLQNSQF